MPSSRLVSQRDSQANPTGWPAELRQRMPVAATVSTILLAGLFVGALMPAVIRLLILLPAEFSHPFGWYRLLTYSLVQASLPHWLFVAAVTLMSGWLAERWLAPRTMWVIVALSALVGGIIYVVVAPPMQPVIGAGFLAAGFAGSAVATSALRRHAISRGAKIVAVVLLLMYGLTPLQADAQSVAMLGAFVVAAGYAAWSLRSPAIPRRHRHTVA